MTGQEQLKKLSAAAVPAALERAKHYRLLNDPEPAQSICEDILAVDPNNQEAHRIRLLVICDCLDSLGSGGINQALECAQQLQDPYAREYYQGLVHERAARLELTRCMPESHYTTLEHLETAMEHYARCEASAPEGNDEALLRWNHCLRIKRAHPELVPRPQERYEPAFLE